MATHGSGSSVWFTIDADSPERQQTLERAAHALVADPEHGWLLRDLTTVMERQGLYAAQFSRRAVELTVCYDPATRTAWGETVSREGKGIPLAAPEYLIHAGAAIVQQLLDHTNGTSASTAPIPSTPLAFPDLRIDPSIGERFVGVLRGTAPEQGTRRPATRPKANVPPGVQPSTTAPSAPTARTGGTVPAQEAGEPAAVPAPTDGDWRERVLAIEERLRAQVFGQDEAIAALRRALVIHAAGLSAPQRPIGGFMFLGPTGVGKTELANALARSLFDDASAMLRLDMSEYMESHALARLVGAPPGYVGYNEGGQLTEFVRSRRRCVVLFDEFDKAHRDVPNILLQVLDAGRLTDGRGNTVDFSEVVLIMTSNLHAELFRQIDLQDPEAVSLVRQAIVERTRRSYRPEFVARLDGLLVFNPLTAPILRKIAEKQFRQIAERAEKTGQEITWERAVIDHLVAQATPDEGARAIVKAARQVLEPLALRILERNAPGGRFRLAVKDDEVVVREVQPRGKRPVKA